MDFEEEIRKNFEETLENLSELREILSTAWDSITDIQENFVGETLDVEHDFEECAETIDSALNELKDLHRKLTDDLPEIERDDVDRVRQNFHP